MADRLIEMRAVADMPGTSMRIASEDLLVIVASIDAQAAEIEAAGYRLLRRGQHWSVIDGVGQTLRGEELDAAVAAVEGKA